MAGKAEIQGEYDTSVVDVIADHKQTSKKDVYTKKSFESMKTQTVTLLDTADSSIKPYELPLTIEYDPGFFGFYASYYLKNGDGSYICPTKNGAEISDKTSVDVVVNSDGSVTISKTLSDKTYYLTVNKDGSFGSTTTKTSLYAYEKTTTGEDRDDTTISFTGKKVGKTSVKIGEVTYIINVTAEDLTKVTPLTIEYWITNAKVYKNRDKNSESSVKISAAEANRVDGIAVATCAPSEGYSFFSGDVGVLVYYWQTMRLTDNNRQIAQDGNDGTSKGETLTHVRYMNSKWQYKTLDGVWKDFQSDDQVVAYYLQKTDVTKEITTYVKDWGYSTENTTPNTSGGKGQVALTIAVVYPDGTVSPAEGELYANSTTIFNYWENRDIGIVSPTNNSDYTISKITVTDGKRDKNTSAGVWYKSDTITWDKKANETGEEWYDETTVWDETKNAGTTPMVNGKNSNITWSAKNTAKLVLIYLKPIEKESNLIVRYWNSSSNEEITRSQVVMTYNQGDQEPTFTRALKDGTGKDIGNITEWPGKTSGEEKYLPDEAYVTNSSGVNQKFNKTLSAVPAVSEKYKSGVYSYNGADISKDGKTLTLYYVVDQTKTKADYVLDFGTPVQIPMSDFVENYANLTSVTWNDSELRAGTLSYNQESKVITYTPKKVLEGSYALNFKLKFNDDTSGSVTIGVVPASNVLYEENFLTGADGWTQEGSAKNDAQTTGKAKTADQNYGFDTTYSSLAGENGVYKAADLTPSKATKALTTSFYGNTFDLIGNCGTDTGRVVAMLTRTSGPKKVFIIDVDTRYNGGTIYQVPLMHKVLGDSDASYNVEIYASGLAESDVVVNNKVMAASEMPDGVTASDDILTQILADKGLTMDDVEYTSTSVAEELAESDASGEAANNVKLASEDGNSTTVHHVAGTHVEIDSFRVYRSTSGTDAVAQNYDPDEQNVTYARALDVVKNQIVAYTEANRELQVSVQDYEAKGGPQNEIYLGKEQSIFFQSTKLANKEIQVSLRAVNTSATANVNGSTISLATNTEMYYTITADERGKVAIVNNTDALLAIVNVKLPNGVTAADCDSPSEAKTEDVVSAISAALYGDEEPEVFTPETFTAKTTVTPVVRNKMVTLKVNVSSDVAYITVNGVKYTRTGLQGLFRKTRTIRVVNTVKKGQTKTYEVVAYNADGVASETITVTG